MFGSFTIKHPSSLARVSCFSLYNSDMSATSPAPTPKLEGRIWQDHGAGSPTKAAQCTSAPELKSEFSCANCKIIETQCARFRRLWRTLCNGIQWTNLRVAVGKWHRAKPSSISMVRGENSFQPSKNLIQTIMKLWTWWGNSYPQSLAMNLNAGYTDHRPTWSPSGITTKVIPGWSDMSTHLLNNTVWKMNIENDIVKLKAAFFSCSSSKF